MSTFKFCYYDSSKEKCKEQDGVYAHCSPPPPPLEPVVCCEDTCTGYEFDVAGDDDCDDGGAGSDFALCDLGTDCSDCGNRCDMFIPASPPLLPPLPPPGTL